MRTALLRLLRRYGYEIELFASGDELLQAPRLPDCIILDLHMPGMNGFTVLQHLASRPAPPSVVVITGHDQPGNVERLRALGASAYLLKPVDAGPLVTAIETALARPSAS